MQIIPPVLSIVLSFIGHKHILHFLRQYVLSVQCQCFIQINVMIVITCYHCQWHCFVVLLLLFHILILFIVCFFVNELPAHHCQHCFLSSSSVFWIVFGGTESSFHVQFYWKAHYLSVLFGRCKHVFYPILHFPVLPWREKHPGLTETPCIMHVLQILLDIPRNVVDGLVLLYFCHPVRMARLLLTAQFCFHICLKRVRFQFPFKLKIVILTKSVHHKASLPSIDLTKTGNQQKNPCVSHPWCKVGLSDCLFSNVNMFCY